jgi:hypothetical protein
MRPKPVIYWSNFVNRRRRRRWAIIMKIPIMLFTRYYYFDEIMGNVCSGLAGRILSQHLPGGTEKYHENRN